MSFTVAIVGRPNVGKSTLFNRLTGKRRALVDDTPGVTRDRREGNASLAGLEFRVFDTAGLEEAKTGSLQARMTQMSEEAIDEADVVMLVVDGRAGITPQDAHFAQMIRKKQKPAVLVVNKAERGAQLAIGDAYALGMGEPVAISAEHGEGLADLYAALAPFGEEEKEEPLEEADENPPEEEDAPIRIAIIGRPNVGKSSLLNRLLGQERTLTGPEAGITRDSILVPFEFEGRKLQLVDTAGMRKKSNVTGKIEKLALADTLEALKYAHVAIWVVDATQPLEKQDNAIAALIEQEGRALILAVNKWDQVTDEAAWNKALKQRLEYVLPQAAGITVVPVSARSGYNIPKLIRASLRAYQQWNREFSTGELNRWLEKALEAHTPPLIKGRRIKIRYMVQKSTRPPSFLLFSNTSDVPEHYLRYLVNDMRERFALPGVPIRVKIRKGNNPYVKER